MSFHNFNVKIAKKDSNIVGIAILVNSCYRGESARLGWTSESDIIDGQRTDPESLLELINTENSCIILLESKETKQLIGCCHVEKSKTSSHMYLGMLSVSPTLQNQGIGKALLLIAEKYCLRWGCNVIEMSVISIRKELQDWYKRHGFTVVGDPEPFPYDNPKVGKPKVEGLMFDVLVKSVI